MKIKLRIPDFDPPPWFLILLLIMVLYLFGFIIYTYIKYAT